MHYTKLCFELKTAGFNCGIYDDTTVVSTPRIYLNGYGDKVKAYLFVDEKRRQNDWANPISGYGLHVGIDKVGSPKEKMLWRCSIKHRIMTDLWMAGFALKPCADFKTVSLN